MITVQPDASTVSDAPTNVACEVMVNGAGGDVNQRADALSQDVVAWKEATIEAGTDTIYVFSVNAPLVVGAEGAAEAALAWVKALPHAPAMGELEVVMVNGDENSVQVQGRRARVEGRAARFAKPAVEVWASRVDEEGEWLVRAVTLSSSVAWATAAEVDALLACGGGETPTEKIRAKQFAGALLTNECEIEGTYTYAPDAADVIELDGDVAWKVLDESGEDQTRWRVMRKGTLELDSSNWFPELGRSDIGCGQRFGFTLEVDGVTGEVMQYRPGIDCVAC